MALSSSAGAESALAALAAPATVMVKASCTSYSDLQSADGQKYTVYNITVTDSEAHTHSLQKRFNESNELYRAIKNQHPEGASNNPLSMRSHSLSHYPTIFHNS